MKRGAGRTALSIAAVLAVLFHGLATAASAAAAGPEAGDSAASPAGRWLADDIRGGGVIDRLQSVLEIAADGRISGTTGCNRMTGKAHLKGAAITIGPIATTRMACSPAIMDQERKFLSALEAVRGWRVDTVRRKLVLLGARGEALVVFARM